MIMTKTRMSAIRQGCVRMVPIQSRINSHVGDVLGVLSEMKEWYCDEYFRNICFDATEITTALLT